MAKEKKQKTPKPQKPPKQAKQKKTREKRQSAPHTWHRLDNTANLFPVITSKRDSNAYRVSLTLNEPVIPELLQQALETVLPWFAAFRVRLRRGIFWRYFEHNPGMPTVQLEDDYPCRYIDPGQNNQFLFRITYYEARVNLEAFHALSDGTGGFQFLKAICCQYLLLAHPHAFTPEQKQQRWFAQHANDTEDSYVANYTPTKKATFSEGRALRLRGERLALDGLRVVYAYMPTKQILDLCRSKGVSITQYITACNGWAIFTEAMHGRPSKTPVNILIPINLRGIFASTTTLNFFSSIYVSLRFDKPGITFDDILAEVKAQFEKKATRKAMQEKISYTVGSGYSPFIRAVPLPLKTLALRAIYEHSVKSSTASYSNMGRIEVPEPFAPYITAASLMLSTSPREPFKCTTNSFGDTFTLGFTNQLYSPALERAIVRHLAAEGLDITIETNGVENEKL